MDLGSNEPVEEGEMSNLDYRFAAQIHKRATSAQGEANPGSEVSSGKSWK